MEEAEQNARELDAKALERFQREENYYLYQLLTIDGIADEYVYIPSDEELLYYEQIGESQAAQRLDSETPTGTNGETTSEEEYQRELNPVLNESDGRGVDRGQPEGSGLLGSGTPVAQEDTRGEGDLSPQDQSTSDIPFRDGEQEISFTAEEQSIVDSAGKNAFKAPNGQSTNLTKKQWAQVRTKAFKDWFGDWLKSARIEKLRSSEPIVISGEEYQGKYELNRDSAKSWLKDNVRGSYVNNDTNESIEVSRVGVDKVTSHNSQDNVHLKSLIAIPQLIEGSIFIEEATNEKENDKYDSYRYYVAGINIGGIDYTAKIVVGVKQGVKYYDHSLIEIEKGNLIEAANGFTTTGNASVPSYTESKDKRLLSLLQTNSSKVVDANGEPLVVYHGTNDDFTKFEFRGISGFPKAVYFSNAKSISESYGSNVMPLFLNIREAFNYDVSDRSFNSAYDDLAAQLNYRHFEKVLQTFWENFVFRIVRVPKHRHQLE